MDKASPSNSRFTDPNWSLYDYGNDQEGGRSGAGKTGKQPSSPLRTARTRPSSPIRTAVLTTRTQEILRHVRAVSASVSRSPTRASSRSSAQKGQNTRLDVVSALDRRNSEPDSIIHHWEGKTVDPLPAISHSKLILDHLKDTLVPPSFHVYTSEPRAAVSDNVLSDASLLDVSTGSVHYRKWPSVHCRDPKADVECLEKWHDLLQLTLHGTGHKLYSEQTQRLTKLCVAETLRLISGSSRTMAEGVQYSWQLMQHVQKQLKRQAYDELLAVDHEMEAVCTLTDVEEEKLAMLFEKCKLLKRIVDFCKEEEMILSKDIKSKLQEAAAQKQHQQFTSAGTLTRPSPTAKSLPKSLEAVTSEHIVGDNALSTQARPLVRSTDAELADRNALDPSMVPVMISSWKPGIFNDVLDDIVSSSSDDSDFDGEGDSRGMDLPEDVILLDDYDNIDMEALLGTVGVSPSEIDSFEESGRASHSSGEISGNTTLEVDKSAVSRASGTQGSESDSGTESETDGAPSALSSLPLRFTSVSPTKLRAAQLELLSLRESVSKAKETVTNLRQENENGVKLSRRDAACQYKKGDVKWH